MTMNGKGKGKIVDTVAGGQKVEQAATATAGVGVGAVIASAGLTSFGLGSAGITAGSWVAAIETRNTAAGSTLQ